MSDETQEGKEKKNYDPSPHGNRSIQRTSLILRRIQY